MDGPLEWVSVVRIASLLGGHVLRNKGHGRQVESTEALGRSGVTYKVRGYKDRKKPNSREIAQATEGNPSS